MITSQLLDRHVELRLYNSGAPPCSPGWILERGCGHHGNVSVWGSCTCVVLSISAGLILLRP